MLTNSQMQKALKDRGFYQGRVDGLFGQKSWQAIYDFLEAYRVPYFKSWGRKRRAIAAQQLIVKQDGFNPGSIDGLWGHNTENAVDDWKESGGDPKKRKLWRDKPGDRVRVSKGDPSLKWPTQKQVRTQSSKYFGKVGTGQTMLQLPVRMRIAWNTKQTITRFSCHHKVKDAFAEWFELQLDAYGEREWRKLGLDLFGGCLNVRAIRGGSVYSIHSWGCAIDIDPARNRLKWGRDKAQLAKPEYKEFWECSQKVGLVGLGPLRNYDWMHLQFARI